MYFEPLARSNVLRSTDSIQLREKTALLTVFIERIAIYLWSFAFPAPGIRRR
jgi:hypothetical protein